MTAAEILIEVRVRLNDVDSELGITSTPSVSDDKLFEYVKRAINYLEAVGITTTQYTASGLDITPEPSLIDGLIIATLSVRNFLYADVASKIRNGDFGVRFKSGQDEISTVEAARRVEGVSKDFHREFRNLVNGKLMDKTTGAAERLT